MLHPTPHEPESGKPVVEIRGVTAGYGGEPVLSHVNLTIKPGDFVALLGPSGSGKTTLMRIILGALKVYTGEVLVEGVSVIERRPRVGYVPQLEAIDWSFPVSVEEVVLMGRTSDSPLLPWYKQEDRELARRIMERLGIAHLAKRHIRDLSGGQQQRAFLARALVSSPRLLLLDEPTAGVDIKTRDDVLHLLDQLNHQGITIIIATHEINAVAAHLPWVVCFNRRIIAEGPPSEVFTPETLKLIYNAEMAVTQYEGMTLVAETPHLFGQHGRRSGSEDASRNSVGRHG